MIKEQRYERCSVCDSFTERAGSSDDSIYVCDGMIGPLCPECYSKIMEEGAEYHDVGGMHSKIESYKRALKSAEHFFNSPKSFSNEEFQSVATTVLEALHGTKVNYAGKTPFLDEYANLRKIVKQLIDVCQAWELYVIAAAKNGDGSALATNALNEVSDLHDVTLEMAKKAIEE